ncbi:MAG: type IV pilus biogenesis/stability protein PilW [Cognaticolwellia sp.]
MTRLSPFFIALLTASTLSGCVTQHYGNDKDTPLIENEASNNEIAMTRISLGLGYLKMGNTQQAKLNLEKAKRFAPNLTQVHSAFAHYYDTVYEPALAIKSYEKALSLDGQNADTLNNYGVFLCRQKQYTAAEQQMLKAIAVPSYILVAQSYENLALCQLQARQFDKAQIYLEKAIDHSPNRASSLLQMMRLQYAKSDYKLAQTYLGRYEKSTRRFSANALALAFKVYAKQGEQRIAKNYGNMLVKMFPNSFEAKQYILNELYQIDADKLAEDYRASLYGITHTKPKKRVVVLSPKSTTVETTPSLSQHGLQPIMTNSVMPTAQEKAQLKVEEPKLAAQNNASEKPKVLIETIDDTGALAAPISHDLALDVVANEPEQVLVNDGETEAADAITETEVSERLNTPTEDLTEAFVDEMPERSPVENETSTDDFNTTTVPMHTVVRGDNLFSISKQYNIFLKSLARWNDLPPPYVLKVGDVLYLADPKSAEFEPE